MKGVVFRCCVVYALQIINVTTTYNFFLKKKGKLGLEKQTTLSFEERRTLSYLDKLKLTFFRKNRKCKKTHNFIQAVFRARVMEKE